MTHKPDHDGDAMRDSPASGIPRRTFIQGILVATAATGYGAISMPADAATPPAAAGILTSEQIGALTTVLDHVIPADGAMPAAGALGIAGLIDKLLCAAPHLRPQVLDVLSVLPAASELAHLSTDELVTILRGIEQDQPEAFNLLLQVTYTGYYRDPSVLEALGGVKSDREGELLLDRFDLEALEEIHHGHEGRR